MHKRLHNRLSESLETEVAVMTCMEIYREEYDGKIENKYDFSQFFSDYYKSHEEEVKIILENEYTESSVNGSDIKKKIEDSERGDFSKTEEVAISRYVRAIYLEGLEKNGPKRFMLDSIGDLNRTIKEASEENTEESLEGEDIDELDEEDIVDLVDEAVEEDSELDKSRFDDNETMSPSSRNEPNQRFR